MIYLWSFHFAKMGSNIYDHFIGWPESLQNGYIDVVMYDLVKIDSILAGTSWCSLFNPCLSDWYVFIQWSVQNGFHVSWVWWSTLSVTQHLTSICGHSVVDHNLSSPSMFHTCGYSARLTMHIWPKWVPSQLTAILWLCFPIRPCGMGLV